MSIWDNVRAGIGGVRSGFFPVDPSIDPRQAEALQRQAMLRLAAGLAGGQSLGQGFQQGYTNASDFYTGATQEAYQNNLRKNALDTQQKYHDQQMGIQNLRIEQDKAEMEQRRLEREDALAQRKLEQEALAEYRKGMLDQRASKEPAESFSPFTQADGTVVLVGNRGTQKPTDLSGKVTPPQSSILRPVPAAAAGGIIANRRELTKLDNAIAAVEANPDAFGTKNYLPDAVTQRVGMNGFKSGIDARAKIADIGSMVIHDRSGAAVTAAEFPRLRPFIPSATDTPETVKTKLKNLRANIAAMNEEAESVYSESAGYKPLGAPDPATAPPAKETAAERAKRLGL